MAGDATIDGASAKASDAWSQVEKDFGGTEHGLTAAGEPLAVTNNFSNEDPEVESARIEHLATSKKRLAVDPRFQGGTFGVDPEKQVQADETDRRVKAALEGQQVAPDTPRVLYDPMEAGRQRAQQRLQPPTPQQTVAKVAEPPAAAAVELDPVDADFFGIPMDPEPAAVPGADGMIGVNQLEYQRHLQSVGRFDQERSAFEAEKASQRAAMGLIMDSPLRTALQLGANRERMAQEAIELGLIAGQPGGPAPHAPGFAPPQQPPVLGEDADPALQAMATRAYQADQRIHQLTNTVGQLAHTLEQGELRRDARDARQTRDGVLAATRGRLVRMASNVPSIQKSGIGELLVQNVMLQLESQELSGDTAAVGEQAAGMLKQAAVTAGLKPSAKARAAKNASRRKPAPVPTTPGRSTPISASEMPAKVPLDIHNPDAMREGGIGYLNDLFHRRQQARQA